MNLFEKYEKERELKNNIQVGSVWMCVKLDSNLRGWIVKITHNSKKDKDILIKKWNTNGMFKGSGNITDLNKFTKYWRELK